MPKPVRARSTASTAIATERAGEVLEGSMGYRGRKQRERHNSRQARRRDLRDPYTTGHDLQPESFDRPWPNAPAWETSCAR
jgi:hypothetical protein